MSSYKINYNFAFRIGSFLFVIFLIWFFPALVLDLFLAYILTLMGAPLAKQISKIRIFKKIKVPIEVSAMIVTILILAILILLTVVFVPLLASELSLLANINYDSLAINLNILLDNIQHYLYSYGIMSEDTTLVGLITAKLREILNLQLFTGLVGNIVSSTGSLIFHLFTIFFVLYFFIKDDFRLDDSVKYFFNDTYSDRLKMLSDKINNLLSRYMIGTLVRTIIMLVLLYVGLALFGIKGAFLMAFMGAVINIIPYLGPIIGCIIAAVFGIIDCMSLEMYTDIGPVVFKIAGVFIGANVVDNVLLQPLIYAQSVRAHPVEIFLITIIGGQVAGIGGMILCIPVYTILRVIIIEIYYFVKNKDLEQRDKGVISQNE